MTSLDPIDVDNSSESSTLTTLESGDTPTLFADELPTIQALLSTKDDAAYEHLCASIPRAHRVKIKGIHYIRYDPYRSKKSKRNAWYWQKDQAEELIQISKGRLHLDS